MTPDTVSETGSMKSRSRRTLPYLPPEEPAPLPTQAKKHQERMRYKYTRKIELTGRLYQNNYIFFLLLVNNFHTFCNFMA